MMRTILVLIVFMLSFIAAMGQRKEELYLVINKNEQCGYRNSKKKMVIPFGTYEHCFTDTFRNHAFVAHKDSGIVAIGRDQTILFQAYVYDNGPDYLSEGLFRIKKKGMIGFANTKGEIVISPQYTSATPFENGEARVVKDGQELIIDRFGKIRK